MNKKEVFNFPVFIMWNIRLAWLKNLALSSSLCLPVFVIAATVVLLAGMSKGCAINSVRSVLWQFVAVCGALVVNSRVVAARNAAALAGKGAASAGDPLAIAVAVALPLLVSQRAVDDQAKHADDVVVRAVGEAHDNLCACKPPYGSVRLGKAYVIFQTCGAAGGEAHVAVDHLVGVPVRDGLGSGNI